MKYNFEIEKNGKSYILKTSDSFSSRSIIVNCESMEELEKEIKKILKELNKITK